MIKAITSKDNPRVKFAYSLKDKKYRKIHKMFLAETIKSLQMAVSLNRVVEVFTTDYLDLPEEIPQNLVSEEIIKKLSSNVNPEGVVFIAKIDEDEVKDANKILYLDDVSDPGNVGTLIRTALAFSFDLVVLSDNSVSPYNEKVINSSKGAIFAIPVRVGEIDKYKGTHKIIVTNLSKSSTPLDEVEVPEKFVLVLGNESHGISKHSKSISDQEVIIPINNIDSLNVSVAGGILMNKIH